MSQSLQVIGQVFTFASESKEVDFIAAFGKPLGVHLWRKYCNDCQFNFMSLWCSLDLASRRKFARYIDLLDKQ